MDILNQFGVNPILLAAQIVNFFILLYLLKRFLYGPILKVLNERKKKIEESLKNAEEIEKKLREMTDKEAEIILKAGKEGEKIIREAGEYAAQLIEDGRKEYEKLINKGVEDVGKMHEAEKGIITQEVKENLAGFVVLTYEKLIGKAPSDDQKKIIEREVKNIS